MDEYLYQGLGQIFNRLFQGIFPSISQCQIGALHQLARGFIPLKTKPYRFAYPIRKGLKMKPCSDVDDRKIHFYSES